MDERSEKGRLLTLPTEVFRQTVAAASVRLKQEPPPQVPCPKCAQERYLTIEKVGPYQQAACACCGFHWMLP